MLEAGSAERRLNQARRRSYLYLAMLATVLMGGFAVREWREDDPRALVGAVVSLLLLLAVLHPRVPLHRLDQMLGGVADVGAVFLTWSVSQNPGPFSAETVLLFGMFLVTWFGVLGPLPAVVRAGLLLSAVLVIGLLRQPPELFPVLFLAFLAYLIGQMTLTGRQIRQEVLARDHYADLAATDPLTGLLNRRALYEALQELYEQAPARAGQELGVLLMDVDHFKTVNDRYGHDIGDQVLQHVAGVLRSCAGERDLVGRWGGEEFLIVVQGPQPAVLEGLSHRILTTLRTIHSGLPPVTLSIGCAHDTETEGVNALLQLADRRLYRAKHQGRDRMNMDALTTLHGDPSYPLS